MRRLGLALFFLIALVGSALAGGGPAETVVLVNKDSPDSQRVAAHYVKARGIPAWQVCEVKCAAGLTVPMTDFVRDVVDPLREFLRRGQMEDRVRFVVLTQGMPIRASTPGGDVSTAAALSLLHSPQCGADQSGIPRTPNPYTAGPACDAKTADGCRFLLVTALLSTTADEAMALVDRSVASDGTAPKDALFLFQDANPAAHVRNETYDAARAKVEALGQQTAHVKVGGAEATQRKRVMGYMAGGSYSNLTPEGVKTNEYLPGAISDQLQSYGAVPQNFGADPGAYTQFPIIHMVRAGITGVHGAVQEPYNISFPDADLFLPYLAGYTLAETFHQRSPLAYWMNLTLGDPLCAPYAVRPRVEATAKVLEKDGVLVVEAKAPGAVRIEVYASGRLVAFADADTLSARVAGAEVPMLSGDGVLVEATGPGTHAPRGWKLLPERTSAIGRLIPPIPVAGAFTPKLEIRAPDVLVAGTPGTLSARLLGPGGAPSSWDGNLEVRMAKPPVRRASQPAAPDADGWTSVPLRWTVAGEVALRISFTDESPAAAHTVRVVAAAPHHATTPLSVVPVRQVTDMPILVEDEFGNVADFDGEIALAVQGVEMRGPAKAKIAKGSGTIEDVSFADPGPKGLLLSDSGRGPMSQPNEGVQAVATAIRAWTVGPALKGDAAARLFKTPDVVAALGKDAARRRERDDVIDVPAPKEGADAFAAATWLDVPAAAKIRLLGASGGRLKIALDGKTVFDGVTKQTDPAGKRELLATLDLAKGAHRLTVAAENKAGALAFSLELAPEEGKPLTDLPFVVAQPAKR